jgi:hypothetical protein
MAEFGIRNTLFRISKIGVLLLLGQLTKHPIIWLYGSPPKRQAADQSASFPSA